MRELFNWRADNGVWHGASVTKAVLPTQEHTNTIRRFQFVSLQEAAAYVAKVSEKCCVQCLASAA